MMKIEIAPMLDLTDRHFRFFLRKITKKSLFYSEMIAEQAILRGNRDRLLSFSEEEKPLVLQLGGSTPEIMAECAKIGETYGYSEININAGCPSSRVESGRFGACLMRKPETIVQIVQAMKQRTHLPITLKTRLGLVGDDIEHTLPAFIETIAEAGVKKFIIHARFTQIGKLSPKENRTKLPLYPEKVFEIKKRYPELEIIFNGEVTSVSQIQELVGKTDGVMIGRASYTNPYFLSEIDRLFYGENFSIPSRKEIAFSMMDYLDLQKEHAPHLFRHLMGLYYGTEVAKIWRSTLMSKNTNEVRRTLESFLF